MSAGSGKTSVSGGILRALTDRGVPVKPFKAVAVVDPDDPAYPDVPAPLRGALHNCGSARVRPQWWHNPVTVVPDPQRRHEGELFLCGVPAGDVPIRGQDSIDLHRISPRLHARCADAVQEALRQGPAAQLVIEGAGAVGELDPEHDLANHLAPVSAGPPVMLVVNAARSGHVTALAGVRHMVAPELLRLVRGHVLNQVRDAEHARATAERTRRGSDFPLLATLPEALLPDGYDGTPEKLQPVYDRSARNVVRSGLLERLGLDLSVRDREAVAAE
ncbi:hypothetical protein OIB37_04220 [Streptomyces sp. NBC_00820]|uniref:hypothetical protein n=1 Tax=Streptomyces sp. NBC_00820 TaxID=2975842 RepID=UPI002ED00247|nr:hypothetical protein OIB37_04220 [Streptomyces sp. NBC_00820]